jgi:hypothetical protein
MVFERGAAMTRCFFVSSTVGFILICIFRINLSTLLVSRPVLIIIISGGKSVAVEVGNESSRLIKEKDLNDVTRNFEVKRTSSPLHRYFPPVRLPWGFVLDRAVCMSKVGSK